mgnify:CR=1 FL=1
MVMMPAVLSDVYSGREIARAAGVPEADVAALLASGVASFDGEFVTEAEAIRLVRALRARTVEGRLKPAPTDIVRLKPAPTDIVRLKPAPRDIRGVRLQADLALGERFLFAPAATSHRATGVPLLASGALHAAAFGLALVLSMIGAFQRPLAREATTAIVTPVRLVFTSEPGPGGGGGGGGLRQPAPPPKAKLKGPSRVSSPVPVRRPPPPVAPPKIAIDAPKPLLKAEALPQIVAPVVSVAGDAADRMGVLHETPADTNSRGPGIGGGVGAGTGTGVGEGDGSGIGPGSGGGYGGGPYRPGSGIDPPRLLREVKPGYTEEARRTGVEGEVVLEIVVRRDGTVGDVRVLQRLGSGLDQKAIDAVRQWRFEAARRLGAPVDVVVKVAVEFKLR